MSFTTLCQHLWNSSASAETWPAFAESVVEMERDTSYRWLRLPERGRMVLLQCNPIRLHSTKADVDADTVAGRPCFLCEDARPREQAALDFGEHWQVLVNIRPIVPAHFTVVSTRHEPQHFSEAVRMMCDLTYKSDGELMVFFNGIGAGATAPDHLHCQAIPSCTAPLNWWLRGYVSNEGWSSVPRPVLWPVVGSEVESESDFEDGDGEDDEEIPSQTVEWLTTFGSSSGVRIGVTRGAIVPAVVVVGGDVDEGSGSGVADALIRVVECCAAVLPKSRDQESPVNVYVDYMSDAEEWLAWVVPRPRFRPSWFGSEMDGPGRLMISPGALDLADFVLAPRKCDFDSVDGKVLSDGLKEVILDPQAYGLLISQLMVM